jgi:fumarylacetoacetate (FAA) hydrolase family protein
MDDYLSLEQCLPEDDNRATLVGRVWDPEVEGPCPIQLHEGHVWDLSTVAPTLSELGNFRDPLRAVQCADDLRHLGSIREILENSDPAKQSPDHPWFLPPCDLQVIKGTGVTFIASLLERVIEEQARGNAAKAAQLREEIQSAIGENLADVKPGSDHALRLKEVLIGKGIWSQYLEVGIGPDAELFTKAPAMSAVGVGAEVGVLKSSSWNNPEPEMVLMVNKRGDTIGATLANDVNLRDIEGRSALMLGKAKDNNASCAIGPFLRLFDDNFTIDDVRSAEIHLEIHGEDGFHLQDTSSMKLISRDPLDLVQQTIGRQHQYPDGFVLLLGTMFAPVIDREETGMGFTHKRGDVVRISSPRLGALVNRVNLCEELPPWKFGIGELMRNLARRGLLTVGGEEEE